ncbi:MAG: UDP-N-acetylmuramoyl-L-alanine--D-glutamate ligase, partial [Oscillospiraceae bacterium]|nr:UDP-N-acetylmuramoyl-L-alanine--D-glutamate ligase [Oscillospiraceae bacterium]
KAAALNAGFTGELILEPEFEKAVERAYKAAESGDTVILSPACTSFDRFKNFAERGRYFKEIVMGLE